MKGCVFCKIVEGELPAYKVYEDDKTLALLDIHPVSPGHTLVITKNPASRNLFDIPLEDWLAMASTAHKIAGAVEKATDADGVNIAMNNREHAGQVVPHPHIHIIPRFKGDELRLWPGKEYKEGEKEMVQEKIRGAL